MARLSNDQASASVGFVAGVAIALASLRHGLGTLEAPDTGFMPFLAGAAMAVLSLIGLLHASVGAGRERGWRPVLAGAAWRRALVVLATLLAYALALPRLGFVVATAIFVAILLRAVRPLRWPGVVAGSVLVAVAAYLLFDRWLAANLPRGPWGF